MAIPLPIRNKPLTEILENFLCVFLADHTDSEKDTIEFIANLSLIG